MRKTFIVLLALACAVVPATAQSTWCTTVDTGGNIITTYCTGGERPVTCTTIITGNIKQTVCN